MATATIVSAWQSEDGGRVCLAASVAEGGAKGTVEYVGCVDNDAAFQAMTNAQKKAALIAAVKAVRDGQAAARQSLAGITGTGTV